MAPRRYIFIFTAIVFVVALFFVFLSRVPGTPPASSERTAVHAYKNPDINISEIDMKAMYVVPKNKKNNIDPRWKGRLASALEKASGFHELQFRGYSKLKYEIFSDPVILNNDDIVYDTSNTNAGNPHGLINVAEEIEKRVFTLGGDLYDPRFSEYAPSAHRIFALIYEGVGASGGMIYDTSLESAGEIAKKLGIPENIVYVVNIKSADGFFILNRQYLSDPPLSAFGASILYHEFAHTIGLPDLFDENNAVFSNDIMGSGREKPLENTYILEDFLKEMGAIQNPNPSQ